MGSELSPGAASEEEGASPVASASPATSWVKVWRVPAHTSLRLICFPHAGGNASIFHSWPEHLPRHIEVHAIQLPGHGERLLEEPYAELPLLIATLADVLLPSLREGPYAFFGHSMGGLLAFELARYLRRQRQPLPRCLFVAGHRAPHLPDPDPPVHQLPDQEFIKELRRLAGTPEEVLASDELLELALPMLRADLAICETYVYRPEPPLECPILVFGGSDDDEVSLAELAAWRQHTADRFNLVVYSGNHFFIHSSRDELLRTVTSELAQPATSDTTTRV